LTGDPGSTMSLVDDPDERLECPPLACGECGAGLALAPVRAQRRHQVTGIEPAPAPKVTEYVAQAKECPGAGRSPRASCPPLVITGDYPGLRGKDHRFDAEQQPAASFCFNVWSKAACPCNVTEPT